MVGDGDGMGRVGEVLAGTTSPMPDYKGFKLQYLVNFQKFSTLRVRKLYGRHPGHGEKSHYKMTRVTVSWVIFTNFFSEQVVY